MIPLLALLFAGCESPDGQTPIHEGIAVGNPPSLMRLQLAGSDDITLAPASLAITSLLLEACDGTVAEVVRVDAAVALDGTDAIEIPGGIWCAVTLGIGRPVHFSGTADNTGAFTFAGTIARVALFGEVAVEPPDTGSPSGDLVLEVARPNWVTQDALALEPGRIREIGPDCSTDDACLRIWHAVADQSGLYADDDGDGAVSTGERDRGTAAEGSGRGD